MNTVLNESLSGIEVVKSMAQEEHSVEKYKDSAMSYRDAGIEQGDIQAKYLPLLLLSVTVTLGLTIAVFYNRAGILSVGAVLGLVGLLLRLRFPVNASIRSFLMLQEAIVGAGRLLEIMNKKSEIYDSHDAVSKEIEGKVKFENVTFSYPGTQLMGLTSGIFLCNLFVTKLPILNRIFLSFQIQFSIIFLLDGIPLWNK